MQKEEVLSFPAYGKNVDLHAYYYYSRKSAAQKAEVCNGAGPRRFGWLIPDTFCGLCITEPANIHDWNYQFGETIEDFHEANRNFKWNMLRMAEALREKEAAANPGWLRRKWNEYMHTRRCEIIEDEYYKAVEAFGGAIFFKKDPISFTWQSLAPVGGAIV